MDREKETYSQIEHLRSDIEGLWDQLREARAVIDELMNYGPASPDYVKGAAANVVMVRADKFLRRTSYLK